MKVRSFYCLFHFEMGETNSQYTEGGSRIQLEFPFCRILDNCDRKSLPHPGESVLQYWQKHSCGSPAPLHRLGGFIKIAFRPGFMGRCTPKPPWSLSDERRNQSSPGETPVP